MVLRLVIMERMELILAQNLVILQLMKLILVLNSVSSSSHANLASSNEPELVLFQELL